MEEYEDYVIYGFTKIYKKKEVHPKSKYKPSFVAIL